jgi:sugar-specific transcriptional regulator TrmB
MTKATTDDDDLVRQLGVLGFALNEARAYVALLQSGASTGYEVSRNAGVPRSAVYTVLRQLVARGAARREPGPPERFTAVPPTGLEALLRRRFDASAKAMREAAQRLDVEPSAPDAFSVAGYDRLLEEATRIAGSARTRLVVSGWPREVVQLSEALATATRRGAFVVVFSHAALPEGMSGLRFSYGLREADLETFWEHRLVVVADDRSSLLGATTGKASDRAVVSETVAIAEIAVSQVALDLTLLAQRHGFDTTEVMAKMLGDRVGRLDSLLVEGVTPQLGGSVGAKSGKVAKVAKVAKVRKR